ncbi:sel1 repeat family protein, partial [Mesorhizobium sp. M00.F.Ca.ET.149.01.1.1]
GLSYYKGLGVPLDYAEAVAWLRKSADQGYAKAENSLGVAYLDGHGVKQDTAQALILIRKAADQGDPTAKANLIRLEPPPKKA